MLGLRAAAYRDGRTQQVPSCEIRFKTGRILRVDSYSDILIFQSPIRRVTVSLRRDT